jgi:hypothetical protein
MKSESRKVETRQRDYGTNLSVPTAIRQNFAFNAATVALPSTSVQMDALLSATDFLTPRAAPLSLMSNLLAPYALSSPSSRDDLESIRGDLRPCDSWDAREEARARRGAANGWRSQSWPEGRTSVCTLSGRECEREVVDDDDDEEGYGWGDGMAERG